MRRSETKRNSDHARTYSLIFYPYTTLDLFHPEQWLEKISNTKEIETWKVGNRLWKCKMIKNDQYWEGWDLVSICGKFGLSGTKKTAVISLFLSRNMLEMKSVSLTLVCLFLHRVVLLLLHNIKYHISLLTRVPSSRVLKNPFLGRQRCKHLYWAAILKTSWTTARQFEHNCAWATVHFANVHDQNKGPTLWS